MKAAAMVGLLVFLSTSALAQTGTGRPWSPVARMTAGQWLEYFRGEPGVGIFEQTPAWREKIALAQGYVSGVADATQGRLWCDKTEVKTHEIDSMVFSDLKALPETRRAQSASGEIIKSLARRFPCNS